MSTSNYSITRDQVIVSALRKLGVVEPADTSATIDANLVTNGAQALNLMIKQWMTEGIKLWTVNEQSFPLTVSKTVYTFGPAGTSSDFTVDKPLRLIQAWLRNNTVSPVIDIPLNIISKQEYNILGSKFSTGIANSIYLNPGVTNTTIKLFLTPDTLTSTTYTVYVVTQRPIYDITNPTDIPDFPNEWMQALVWGLADQMAIEFQPPANIRQEIMVRADKYKEQMIGWDIENEPTFFQPDVRNFSRFGTR